MKNKIRISLLNSEGEEDDDSTEMLANMLSGKKFNIELSDELASEIATKIAKHFKDPVDEIEISCPGTVSASQEDMFRESMTEHKIMIFPGR